MNVSEVLADLDPQEKRRLEEELAEVIDGEMMQMAKQNPQTFKRLLAKWLEMDKQIENQDKGDQSLAQSEGQEQTAEAIEPEQENQ